jgi:hypothetical protein
MRSFELSCMVSNRLIPCIKTQSATARAANPSTFVRISKNKSPDVMLHLKIKITTAPNLSGHGGS